jgi:PilZ domain/SPOR domain
MDRHAYINIEPNNGGIVLNVSEGGLCFHSFDPVPRNGTIRFWFSDQNQRIDAEAALAWTDETQKGGLRFTTIPEEAREKIRSWMSQPSASPSSESAAGSSQPPRLFPVPKDRRPDDKVSIPSAPPVTGASPPPKVVLPLSGFSRGLATGLAVSVFVVIIFVFQSYRREFGESLIQLGERFAAKPQTQTLTASAAAPTVMAAQEVVSAAPRPAVEQPPQSTPIVTQTVSVPRATPAAADPKPQKVLAQEKLASQPASVSKPLQARVEPAALIAPTPSARDSVPKTSVPVSTPIASSKPPAMPPPASVPASTPASATSVASNTAPVASNSAPVPKVDPARQPDVQAEASRVVNPNSTSELYFDVGKFKSPSQAHDESDRLAQLGFPVTAVQKGFLWTNSFHVLVGPYADEEHAKLTHENLVTNGFKPRAFEKGSRDFTLVSPVTLGGARTPEGEYTIRWESYIGDASVKFMRDNSVVAEADGKWVKHETKYPRDAYVYKRNADGSHTLLEIHFEGMRQALVF